MNIISCKEKKVQCKAKSKRSGVRCKNNAVRGKVVCRMHGAFAGPKTAKGIARIKKANTRHGKYTKEAFADRRAFRKMVKEYKKCLTIRDI
ncbi:MAG: HGGxSTG domain-containing protein [Candidatus Thorarchaeota archaeon]